MRETKNKKIKETTYYVTQLGSMEGRRVLLKLAKILTPLVIDKTITNKHELENKLENIFIRLVEGISRFVDNLSEEDFSYVMDVFIPTTSINLGGSDTITLDKEKADLHFAGKYLEMLEWLQFCIEVNYSDFLPDRGLIQKLIHLVGPQEKE